MISELATQSDNATAPVLLFAVPVNDVDALSRLPHTVRDGVRPLLGLLEQIHHAKSKSAEAEAIAASYKSMRGYSAESLLRKYYKYRQTGDWREVIDKAAAGPAFWQTDAPVGLPKEFVEFWKSLCERNQRKTAPARRELIRIWQTGKGLDPATGQTKYYKTFPGYPEWRPAGGATLATHPSPLSTDLPPGWSVANLNRNAPSKFELAVARRGREAASAHRRKVFTSRVGLHVGEFYLFDDLQYDMLVNFPGNRQATPPLGLIALDLLSACAVGIGFKPTIIDVEGAKRKLKERDMLWMLIDVLCNRAGYRTDQFGTTLIAEHGTAAIPVALETAFDTVSQGKIRVQRSGLSSEHMAGLFEGASKGNPRFKAALESLINLIHNEGAALPAQTGKDRDHKPTELHGLQEYNKKLLKLAANLPEHRARLLQMPVMSYPQFCEVTLDIFRNINHRTDHELEGWERCHHICQEYFLSLPQADSTQSSVLSTQRFSEEQWLALAPHQRKALKAASMVNARARQLSPQEVWNRHAGELQKLPEHAIPIILGPSFGEERAVKGGYINIEDQEISPDVLRFPAYPHGSTGDKFLCYLNPHNPDRLILTNAKGAFVGVLEKQFVPCRSEVEAIRQELGRARHEEAEMLAPVQRRAVPLIQARTDMHRHNAAVMHGQPVTPEEIDSARELRARIKRDGKAATDDMLGCNDALPPSAQDAPAASSPSTHETPTGSVLDDTILDEML